jgi:hypothetical protein
MVARDLIVDFVRLLADDDREDYTLVRRPEVHVRDLADDVEILTTEQDDSFGSTTGGSPAARTDALT